MSLHQALEVLPKGSVPVVIRAALLNQGGLFRRRNIPGDLLVSLGFISEKPLGQILGTTLDITADLLNISCLRNLLRAMLETLCM